MICMSGSSLPTLRSQWGIHCTTEISKCLPVEDWKKEMGRLREKSWWSFFRSKINQVFLVFKREGKSGWMFETEKEMERFSTQLILFLATRHLAEGRLPERRFANLVQRTLTYFLRESITVRLTSSFICWCWISKKSTCLATSLTSQTRGSRTVIIYLTKCVVFSALWVLPNNRRIGPVRPM